MNPWRKRRKYHMAGGASVHDYRNLRKAYNKLLHQSMDGKVVLRKSVKNHYELLKDYEALRYNRIIEFLIFLKIIKERKSNDS